MKRKKVLPLVGLTALFIAVQHSYADSPPTITHDVVFKVGTNSGINWFEIDNPSVGGTITVSNQPYPNTDDLNTAVVDISRNRLMYVDDTGPGNPAYAIDLTGLTFVPGAATSVTVSPLGDWPQGNDNAGYNKANGRVYYHVYNSIELRYLNFDAGGNISGYTTVGNFNGASFTTSTIRAGDLDFDSSGNIWVSGINSGSDPRLWSFNPSTLTVITNKNPTANYPGIVFDATGTTLYGYRNRQYGIIDPSSGDFLTVLEPDSPVFNTSGDLAEGIATIAVPEPSGLASAVIASLLGMLFLAMGQPQRGLT